MGYRPFPPISTVKTNFLTSLTEVQRTKIIFNLAMISFALKLSYMHHLMKENMAEADTNPEDAENTLHKLSPVPLPLTAGPPIPGCFWLLALQRWSVLSHRGVL